MNWTENRKLRLLDTILEMIDTDDRGFIELHYENSLNSIGIVKKQVLDKKSVKV